MYTVSYIIEIIENNNQGDHLLPVGLSFAMFILRDLLLSLFPVCLQALFASCGVLNTTKPTPLELPSLSKN